MKLTSQQEAALEKLVKCTNVKRLKKVLNIIVLTMAARGESAVVPIKADTIEDFAFLYEFLEEVESVS